MRIAIASDNGETVAGHAGRCACFVIFESQADGSLGKTVVPNRHTVHAQGDCHGHEPGGHTHSHHSHGTLLSLLEGCDVFISRGMGPRLRDDLVRVGIQAAVCDEPDALRAAERWIQGTLQSAGAGQCNHG
jgi:predicted Fe-Mo cluster-binding NifX family protein